jgi:hypothetical protein
VLPEYMNDLTAEERKLWHSFPDEAQSLLSELFAAAGGKLWPDDDTLQAYAERFQALGPDVDGRIYNFLVLVNNRRES